MIAIHSREYLPLSAKHHYWLDIRIAALERICRAKAGYAEFLPSTFPR